MAYQSRRSSTAVRILLLGGVALNILFVNCSGSSGFDVSSVSLSAASLGSSAGTPDPSPIPKGPVPPVPPDVLPPAMTPAWFGTHAVNEWFAIPNSVHAGSPAAPTDDPTDQWDNSTRRLSYSNISQKDSLIILAATGGHDDYSGNEVTSIELGVDNPSWTLLMAGTPDSQKIADAPYFQDNHPNSRHAYNSIIYSTTYKKLILHRTCFMWSTATSTDTTNGFDLTTNQWDPIGTYPDGKMAEARDSNDNVWAVDNYRDLYKWTATTGTWAITGSFANIIGKTGMAWDSRRSQLFQLSWGDGLGDGTGVTSAIYDSNGLTQTPITFQDSAAYRSFQSDMPANATMVYDPVGDRYFFWDGISGRLYQITPNSTTTWDMSILAVTGTIPPTASYSYGRMAYVPSLRGLVVMPSGYQSLYFIRLN